MTDTFDPRNWNLTHKVSFDSSEARRVVGPVDALRILECRKRLITEGFEFPNGLPADVFIFSIGEPKQRDITKIGGLPYLSRLDDWPCGRTGEPMPFAAQVDFRNSKDFVGKRARGDLLLIFGEFPAEAEDLEVHFRWVDVVGETELIAPENIPVAPAFEPFFGIPWRTTNYPNALEHPANSFVFDEDSTPVLEPWQATTIYGTQIGEAPFLLSCSDRIPNILCSLGPLTPVFTGLDAKSGPYPYLNCEDSVGQPASFQGKIIAPVERWSNISPGSILLVLTDDDGNLRYEFQF